MIDLLINYKKVAYVIVEAEKSQDLSSASWRHRRADGIAPVQTPAGSSLKESRFVSSSPQGGKDQYPSSSVRQAKFPLTQPFCSIQAFNGLDEAHPRWERQCALLCLLIRMLILPRNTLIDSPRIMDDPASGHPWPSQLDT